MERILKIERYEQHNGTYAVLKVTVLIHIVERVHCCFFYTQNNRATETYYEMKECPQKSDFILGKVISSSKLISNIFPYHTALWLVKNLVKA